MIGCTCAPPVLRSVTSTPPGWLPCKCELASRDVLFQSYHVYIYIYINFIYILFICMYLVRGVQVRLAQDKQAGVGGGVHVGDQPVREEAGCPVNLYNCGGRSVGPRLQL